MTQPITADDPRPGYYWMRRVRNGPRLPVAIWRKDGKLVCRVGPDMIDEDRIADRVWMWCAENKVDKDAAKFAFEKGYWPDEPPPIAVGHNAPPSDPFEELSVLVEAKQKQAQDWLKAHPTITSQTDCDYARNAQAELLALGKQADEMFKAEKAPLLKQTKAVDEKYRFRDTLGSVAGRLRQVFTAFMVKEEARLKAEADKRHREEMERVAAERKRLEAERAKLMQVDPIAALTSPEPELPLMPAAPEPVKVQAGGGVGRKAGLKDNWVAIIDDYPKALAHFGNHPDVKALVQKLATHVVKDAKGAIEVPGVTVKNERIAA